MPIVRASDIGNYLYCHRAWWYRKQGLESENKAELAAGTDLHRHHGRKVLLAGILRALALLFILVALVMLTAYCTVQVLQ